jgi:fructose-1,6-bisphosphatase I
MTMIDLRPKRAEGETLESYLRFWSASIKRGPAVAAAVAALAEAGAAIGALISQGPLQGAMGAEVGSANADGDSQRKLDIIADAAIVAVLRRTPTAYYASEEEDTILTLNAGGELAVAVDPLDGSSNIDANITIGTLFSILPAVAEGATASFFRPGVEQLAAGYIVYGPHLAMMLTLGEGVAHFVFDPVRETFVLVGDRIMIAPHTREFAINASNYRHWQTPVRTFVDDCLEGANGPHGKDFNMRWVASLVAEAHRILIRGGVFLYPGDLRPGYENGRLRLLYEANPIAFLVEQAGGGAIDGEGRVLERTPQTLHERTPLIFGSVAKVERIASYCHNQNFERSRPPLFGLRGLFQA